MKIAGMIWNYRKVLDPYNVKEFLENPVAVAEVRRGMQSKLDNTREMIRQMEVFINELREKIRKGEKR